jgi:hypothetical protein
MLSTCLTVLDSRGVRRAAGASQLRRALIGSGKYVPKENRECRKNRKNRVVAETGLILVEERLFSIVVRANCGLSRHWTITQASYADIPDQAASWFIDPPYRVAGRAYRFHDINYPALGDWCMSRRGQVMVCENAGADWLPFRPFRTIKGLEGKRGGKKSEEVIWTNGGQLSRDTVRTVLTPDRCGVLREDDSARDSSVHPTT